MTKYEKIMKVMQEAQKYGEELCGFVNSKNPNLVVCYNQQKGLAEPTWNWTKRPNEGAERTKSGRRSLR